MRSIKTMVAGIGFIVLAMCMYVLDASGFVEGLAIISFVLGVILFFVGLRMKVDNEPQPTNEEDEMVENESEKDYYEDEE